MGEVIRAVFLVLAFGCGPSFAFKHSN